MEFKISFCALFILNLAFLVSITTGNELSETINTKSAKKLNDRDNHEKHCKHDSFNACGSHTNMNCQNNKCVCDSDFKWDHDRSKCIKTCSLNATACIDFDINRHCRSSNQIYD